MKNRNLTPDAVSIASHREVYLWDGVIANSNKRVWWNCKEGHEWSGLIANRARKGKADPGCPYCSGRKWPERPIRLD